MRFTRACGALGCSRADNQKGQATSNFISISHISCRDGGIQLELKMQARAGDADLDPRFDFFGPAAARKVLT